MSYYKNIIALRVRRGSRAPGRHRHPAAAAAIAFILRPHHGRGALRATSYTEDDFYCPVCQEVLKTPVRTAACQHVFCRKCFLTAMRESGIHCPLCRGNVTRRERACPERALDLENIMRKFSGSCRCCAKQIKFYRMRHHYKSCKKYQDEYGVSSLIPNFQISQDSVGNSSSGHPTFKCPLCQESNFTRQRLLDHCNSNHLFQIVPVNLQLDEETQYQTAVEESFQVNILQLKMQGSYDFVQ
uniref:E3 ubiquitin-protein ligase RNF138 n=1 Tax=Bos mutus grunniens TaxID=30521 RepID=A0A8B9Y3S5_BOSMU